MKKSAGKDKEKSRRGNSSAALKKKMLLSIGALMVLIVAVLSLISFINLNSVYRQTISSTQEGFDDQIKIAVETVVSALDTNYQQYLSGSISESEAMETAKKIVRDTRYNNGEGYFWADMADGLCIVHMNPANEGAMRYDAQDMEGTYYIRKFIELGNAGGGYSDFYFTKPNEDPNLSFKKRGYTLKFEPYGWYVSTGNYYQDTDKIINAFYAEKRLSLIITLGAGIIIAVIGILILARSIGNVTKPLQKAVRQISVLAKGGIITEGIAKSGRRDEIGQLENSVYELSHAVGAQSEVISRMSEGDFSLKYHPRSERDSVGQSIEKMLTVNNNVFAEINNSSRQVDSISQQVSAGAQVLAHGSMEQASGIDELSANISTVLRQTNENAENAREAMATADETAKLMTESTANIGQMQSAMEGISYASQNIAKVIKVIDDIAFQTNILALNAAVEAARAGQHGKGFAVVAEEVRNLASKSAEAAKETAELISGSVNQVAKGNEIAIKTGESIKAATVNSRQMHSKIKEINTASHEQEKAIEEINEGIAQINQIVQSNTAASQESAALSQEMSHQASLLANIVSRFKLTENDTANESHRRSLIVSAAKAERNGGYEENDEYTSSLLSAARRKDSPAANAHKHRF
jgi:methyl-accepting chemotaxis protein